MRYLALACDYDGTLSGPTGVDAAVIDALERFRNAGKSLILVTGRELEGLLRVFPHIRLFDCVVAENGALVYRPEGREIRILGKAPPEDFLSDLRARGVRPLSAGRVIVSTREPHEKEIIQSIRELGLELQIIFNKGAVMVLPAGLNKAVGLRAAVRELGLSVHNTAGIGDAENDFSFLDDCELSVAVSSALPMLKSRVDFVTRGEAGEGVIETIDALLSAVPEDKLRPAPGRHEISIGVKADGARVCFDPYAANIMLAGTSGSGKSTLALSLMERLIARDYQVCVIDPEGDYGEVAGMVQAGSAAAPPDLKQTFTLLEEPDYNVVINLMALEREARPAFFDDLFFRLLELRNRTGRPHWIIADEAHHLFPSGRPGSGSGFLRKAFGVMWITVHPEHVSKQVLALNNMIIAVGETREGTIRAFSRAAGAKAPGEFPLQSAEEALVWRPGEIHAYSFCPYSPRAERRRHSKKYAEGELPPDRSFYFTGPGGKLKLRAQNLFLFIQTAEGVDNETWVHHLRSGDVSRWFRESIKDDELADEAREIEQSDLNALVSRDRIRRAIERRYTLPA